MCTTIFQAKNYSVFPHFENLPSWSEQIERWNDKLCYSIYVQFCLHPKI